MALNCYTGLMGSGKSYEVISTVLINALAKGRRVVCNIDGLDYEAIVAYIRLHFPDAGEIGELVHVTNDDVMKPGFFPTDKTVADGKSIVRPGDLVIIDECWRFWGTGEKITAEHREFFRMHRHYVCEENGHACDIVMMIQDMGSLNRGVRDVVEMSTKTVKLKALGFHKKYRIEVYETGKMNKSTQLDYFVKNYKPEIFPLYSSYKGGKGKELVVDDRQNVLKNKKWYFIFGFIAAVAILVFAVRTIYHYLHPVDKDAVDVSEPGAAVVPAAAGLGHVAVSDASRSELRYVGRMTVGLGEMVVFADKQNSLHYEFSTACSGPRLAIHCVVDGKPVTASSGTFPSSGGGMASGVLGMGKK